MKYKGIILGILLAIAEIFITQQVLAAPAKKETQPAPAATSTSGTSRKHNFEDLLVDGKYHFSDEAISTVEADKVFDSLIGVRTDFKDRIEVSSSSK